MGLRMAFMSFTWNFLGHKHTRYRLYMDALESLRRQYHALLPSYLLRLPDAELLAIGSSQQFLLNRILNEPLLSDRRPEKGYQRTFWRKIITELEKGVQTLHDEDPDCEMEVDEVFYEHLATLMISSPESDDLPKQSYRTFVYDHPAWSAHDGQEGRVTLLEEQVAIQAGTTGLRTWTASLHLAHHILHSPHLLFPSFSRGQLPPCIELGAGTGFLSILLAQLGSDVIATDLDGPGDGRRQAPLQRLMHNVQLSEDRNDSSQFQLIDADAPGPCRVEALDWSDASLPPHERPPIWKELKENNLARTVLAADVIYDPDLVPMLVNAIRTLTPPAAVTTSPPVAIVSATVRNPTTLELFVDTCKDFGLTIEVLDLIPMDQASPTFWDSALDAGSEVRIMRISNPV